jgi:hypothetical protein
MPRGGYRPGTGGKRAGAGRKKGSVTRRTRKTNALAQKAAGEGPLPLQVLLEAMRYYHAKGDLSAAAEVAKAAAPYCHPKLAAVQPDQPPQLPPVPLTQQIDDTERALLQLAKDMAAAAAKDSAPAPVVVEAPPAGGACLAGTP